jgi:hypothetical protein
MGKTRLSPGAVGESVRRGDRHIVGTQRPSPAFASLSLTSPEGLSRDGVVDARQGPHC